MKSKFVQLFIVKYANRHCVRDPQLNELEALMYVRPALDIGYGLIDMVQIITNSLTRVPRVQELHINQIIRTFVPDHLPKDIVQ